MIQGNYLIKEKVLLQTSIVRFKLDAYEIARNAHPGQFINIKIDETTVPLLRRPFSICNIENDEIEIVFSILGMGTKKLTCKLPGEKLDIIGPLGKPFNLEEGEDLSILIGGGLGAAPLPFLSRKLLTKGKEVVTFLGAKSKNYLLKEYLTNLHIATDDGSEGYHGNVVKLLENSLNKYSSKKVKIYACGPTPMLVALQGISEKYNIKCEMSLETMMACGIGLCQGCAVRLINSSKKYALSCIEGPVFSSKEIIL